MSLLTQVGRWSPGVYVHRLRTYSVRTGLVPNPMDWVDWPGMIAFAFWQAATGPTPGPASQDGLQRRVAGSLSVGRCAACLYEYVPFPWGASARAHGFGLLVNSSLGAGGCAGTRNRVRGCCRWMSHMTLGCHLARRVIATSHLSSVSIQSVTKEKRQGCHPCVLQVIISPCG